MDLRLPSISDVPTYSNIFQHINIPPGEAASAAPPGMPRAAAPWRWQHQSPAPRGSPWRRKPRQLDGHGGRFWGRSLGPWETLGVFPKKMRKKMDKQSQTHLFPRELAVKCFACIVTFCGW